MNIKRQEVGAYQYRNDELEAKIDAAKGWTNERNREVQREAFQDMANLIARRSPEHIAELEAQIFGYYI